MGKKLYKLADDGDKILASSAADLVRIMRDSSLFLREQSSPTYMKDFAERYETQTGNNIRFDSADNFVTDLLKFGFLTEIN